MMEYFFKQDGVYRPLCTSGFNCFLSFFDFGLRNGGGIGDVLRIFAYKEENYYLRFFLSILFFLVIIIVLLNIVFGIIIDTFAELREETTKKFYDIHNVCFICGAEKSDIEKKAINFKQHVEKTHNCWNYIYYILSIREEDPQDLNAVNSYTLGLIETKSIVWLPEDAGSQEEK